MREMWRLLTRLILAAWLSYCTLLFQYCELLASNKLAEKDFWLFSDFPKLYTFSWDPENVKANHHNNRARSIFRRRPLYISLSQHVYTNSKIIPHNEKKLSILYPKMKSNYLNYHLLIYKGSPFNYSFFLNFFLFNFKTCSYHLTILFFM